MTLLTKLQKFATIAKYASPTYAPLEADQLFWHKLDMALLERALDGYSYADIGLRNSLLQGKGTDEIIKRYEARGLEVSKNKHTLVFEWYE